MAAAVMMIEPTLHQPASEIIEMLMGMLGVDPDRVIAQAFAMTKPMAPWIPVTPLTPATPTPPAVRKPRGASPRKRA
jgi:hypothetical protein